MIVICTYYSGERSRPELLFFRDSEMADMASEMAQHILGTGKDIIIYEIQDTDEVPVLVYPEDLRVPF